MTSKEKVLSVYPDAFEHGGEIYGPSKDGKEAYLIAENWDDAALWCEECPNCGHEWDRHNGGCRALDCCGGEECGCTRKAPASLMAVQNVE